MIKVLAYMNECLHIVIKEDKAASLHVFSISCFQHMFKNNKTAEAGFNQQNGTGGYPQYTALLVGKMMITWCQWMPNMAGRFL